MSLQNTLRSPIRLTGIEPYGGNAVNVTISPAEENAGIVFQTPRGDVKANLYYASASRNSILLDNGRVKVINVEHILATLYAYGIDNALIRLERLPSRSFKFLSMLGVASDVAVVPNNGAREKNLCDMIDDAGLEQQKAERTTLGVKNSFGNGMLWFEPAGTGLAVAVTTNYPIPGEQSFELQINAVSYRDELARSRPYAKGIPAWMPLIMADAIASFWYPTFGIDHGHNASNVFLPVRTKKEWHAQETSPAEIARHTIVDRLGALALLDGRLDGVKVTARYSGHVNDLMVLKENISRFVRK